MTTTGIQSITTSDMGTVAIYPDPANTNVNLLFNDPQVNTQIQVYNMLGEIVYQSQANSSKISIATSQWSEGLYMIRISSDAGTVSKPLIIRH